jgi:predicted O-linked N-acetylglucosamine transferase (SPINDLY family)
MLIVAQIFALPLQHHQAGRFAEAEALSNLGLAELVSYTEDDYVRIAVELANDLPRLHELHRTLRGRVQSSVLVDGPRFARNIEAACGAMWQRWCLEESVP